MDNVLHFVNYYLFIAQTTYTAYMYMKLIIYIVCDKLKIKQGNFPPCLQCFKLPSKLPWQHLYERWKLCMAVCWITCTKAKKVFIYIQELFFFEQYYLF